MRMTVQDIRDALEAFDEDMPVVLASWNHFGTGEYEPVGYIERIEVGMQRPGGTYPEPAKPPPGMPKLPDGFRGAVLIREAKGESK